MSGSTGIISGTQITPTTTHGEEQRQTERAIGAFPGLHEGERTTVGIVTKIHESTPRLVKAYSPIDNSPIAGGNWIELNHSSDEIVERWGTIRAGFRIRVSYSGPSGSGASGLIIGTEGQQVADPHIPNEVARGLFAIFTPGIGVG